MILESLANGLVQALIGFTISVAIVFAIEQLPLGLTAAHRSWMWRAVYLKTLVWLVFPATLIAPLEMCVRPWMPQLVPASWIPRFESPAQPLVRS
ncbi:MAG: hypothetical protein ACK5OB_06435, partial [Pirellula sp.]